MAKYLSEKDHQSVVQTSATYLLFDIHLSLLTGTALYLKDRALSLFLVAENAVKTTERNKHIQKVIKYNFEIHLPKTNSLSATETKEQQTYTKEQS